VRSARPSGHAQLGTGALSDRIGRKWLISAGMLIQAGALALVAGGTSYGPWIVVVVLFGWAPRWSTQPC
jgi:MFS family permease